MPPDRCARSLSFGLERFQGARSQVDSLNLTETQVPRLFHYSRKYALTFDVEDPDGYFLVFRPGINQEESTELVLGGWLRVLPHVQAWAGRVKEAVDAENLTG